MVVMPVKLATAARSERVSFNQLHEPCMSRIRQQIYCPVCDRTVERDEIIKGYEREKGAYVPVGDESLKAIAPESSQTMSVTEFVPLAEIDALRLETSYYLAPDKGGEKPYALLRAALVDTGCAGIARICMHSREHVVVIRPCGTGLTVHTMYYDAELNADHLYQANDKLVSPSERKLARSLVEAMRCEFDPTKFADTYQESVMQLIDTLASGRKPKITKLVPRAASKASSMEDLLAASLKATAAPPPTGRKRRIA
jgi:DNA end-binding protein Ku